MQQTCGRHHPLHPEVQQGEEPKHITRAANTLTGELAGNVEHFALAEQNISVTTNICNHTFMSEYVPGLF